MSNESSILQQFIHESDTWKRGIAFIEEENLILKNHLSEILGDTLISNEAALDRLEYFHGLFLQEDEKIKHLWREIRDEDKLLTRDIYEDGILFKEVRKMQKKLRFHIEVFEQDFNKLKAEFNAYIAELLS